MTQDVIGIGFGPANLALAIALSENDAGLTASFVERQQRFGWHRGMLIEGTTMQISFLKDLATMRNPASAFGFLSYLHECGRLVDFINHKALFPTRVEFHDYLEWAASRFADQVQYGTRVSDLRPVKDADSGTITAVDVVTADGTVLGRTRNVVLGLGLRPRLPDGVHVSERVWHNYDLLTRLPTLPPPRHNRFVVVGAGQSAAEVVEHLHTAYPAAEICAVFGRYGYSPADDSSFANRIFDPSAVDEFFRAPAPVKQSLLAYHGNTNYSVVDGELIEELYRRSYQEKVRGGDERLRILNTSQVASLDRLPDGVRVWIDRLTSGERLAVECDALIFATGYDATDPASVLGELTALCQSDEQDRLIVGRDYRVATAPSVMCGIYLQGGTEHTHGLSSSLLSNAAVRAGDIVESLVAAR